MGNYIIDGTIGGLLYTLVSKYGYKERYDIIRRLLMGAIGGLIVYYLGFPNHITSMTAGYTGIDAIEGMILRTAESIRKSKKPKGRTRNVFG